MPSWWEAVRPLWHFGCILSLIYVLLFAASDYGAGYFGNAVDAGQEPLGHSSFCYVQRLLDFGPLNTKYLSDKANCTAPTIPNEDAQ